MTEFIVVMKALSDSNRVKLLKILQHRVLCVCEIQAMLGIAQPTVSRHLKILEEAGLVFHAKDGLWVNYHLADGSQSPYASSILGNLRHWLNDDQNITDTLKKLHMVDRIEICKKQSKVFLHKSNRQSCKKGKQ